MLQICQSEQDGDWTAIMDICFSAFYKRRFPHIQSALLLLQLGTSSSCSFIYSPGSFVSVIPRRYTGRKVLLDSPSFFVFSRPEKNPFFLSFSFYIETPNHSASPLLYFFQSDHTNSILADRCKTGHRRQRPESIPDLWRWVAGAQNQHPPGDCGQSLSDSAVGTLCPGMTSCSVLREVPDVWEWDCSQLPPGCLGPVCSGGMGLATRSCPVTLEGLPLLLVPRELPSLAGPWQLQLWPHKSRGEGNNPFPWHTV